MSPAPGQPEGPALVWCPFADEDSAAAAASTLLDEGLIACANILPPMRSLYCWQGERGESRECGALLKTDAALLERACARLAEIHPYQDPAILGWRCAESTPATALWLGALLADKS
ncbi:divalent-cation tolerance protein CutA [Altericroceibacterium xinjiangense]|uniref:divalent-cation tolerance protein CutA n=1 Tax=Altericroceibacterium xinjiangense TaxID=762261 RepID=UPI000F7F797D|nr:divalent-cation tolerance protein CutA [Altericroceibacterium xinjiangense]